MNEQGSATTELVLLVPVLLGLLLLVVLAGRVTGARNELTGVARDAARAASWEATPADAHAAAQRVVTDALADGVCSDARVTLDVRSGAGGHIEGGTVRVGVTCRASTSDLALLAIPGAVTLRATGSESVDRYRSTR